MIFLSKSVEETNKIAADFLNKITDQLGGTQGEAVLATTVGLFGDLGSGKTTFTQAIAKNLGVEQVVTSPTFVIMKRYEVSSIKYPVLNTQYPILNTKYSNLIHIDAYRLDLGQELLSLDFAEILKDPKNLILIEWPERVAEILPKNLIKINFKFISETEREIEL